MTKLEEIGKRIKDLRESKKISQDELAKAVGYKTRSSINKIELGKTNLSQSRITKIANALDTSPGYIMGWKSSIILSEEEEKIILNYRNSDKKSKLLIRQILDIE